VTATRPLAWARLAVALACLALLWAPFPGHAQQYNLRFSRTLNRMSWSHTLPSLTYQVPVRMAAPGDSSSMLRITASGSLSSTLDERPTGNTWQDLAAVNSAVNYPILGPRASIGIGATMSVRKTTLTQQKNRNQTLNFRFQYSPFTRGRFSSLRVNVTPGIIHANRVNRATLDSAFAERGVQYSASLQVNPELSLGGQKLTPAISLGKTDNTLTANRNRTDDFSTSFGYALPGQVRTQWSFGESRSQLGAPRKVVTEATAAGLVTRDTAVAIELSASRNTHLSGRADAKVAGFDLSTSLAYGQNLHTNTASADQDLGNRYFGTDRRSDNWNLESEATGKLTRQVVSRAAARWTAQDERYLPVRLAGGGIFRDPSSDLAKRSLFLSGSLDWQLGEGRSLKLAGRGEMERGRNPGDRTQDRDTHRNGATVSYEVALASGAQIKVVLDRSYEHKVNLDAAHSGDNYRNRDLGLNLDSRYERLGCSVSHTFGVSAKRTVFDFDRQLSPAAVNRQSSIRRSWSTAHSLRRPLLAHLQVSGRYSYRAEDFGRLLAEDEAQIVEEDDSDHNANLGMTYSLGAQFSTSVNYTYRLDRQWQHDYSRGAEERYLYQRTPYRTLSLSTGYNPSSTTRLALQGSRSRQRTRTFDSFSVSYSRTL
jgi:hypothetical protein